MTIRRAAAPRSGKRSRTVGQSDGKAAIASSALTPKVVEGLEADLRRRGGWGRAAGDRVNHNSSIGA